MKLHISLLNYVKCAFKISIHLFTFLHLFVNLFGSLRNEHYNVLLVVGKELYQIATELIEEFKELSKLPSINYAIQKIRELYSKVSDILFCYV
jgi:hypothetical protein